MQRISYESLVDLAEGLLDPDEAQRLRVRIAADPDQQAELAALEELIGLMRSDASADAPEHVVNRALRLMRPRAAAPAPGALRRYIATLKSDSWRAAPLAAGFRSLQAWPRVLLLSAGDRELDLQISQQGDSWLLQGQILGPEGPGEVVLGTEELRVMVPLNDLGEFVLPAVPGGRYTLVVTQGEIEIVVSDLELGPSSSKS
jgi:hypothetical protein